MKPSPHTHAEPSDDSRPAPDGRKRVIIERLRPNVNSGRYPVKRAVGQSVDVIADIFADGHDKIAAVLLCRPVGAPDWFETGMTPSVNDRWHARFVCTELHDYEFTVEAWIDHFATWQDGARKKHDAEQDIAVELQVAARFASQAAARATGAAADALNDAARRLASSSPADERYALAVSDELANLMRAHPDRGLATRCEQVLRITVDRPKALFSAWYELFPRSADTGGHGTFKDCHAHLPRLAAMGFDVLYLPPIHPIGETNRKGKNNAPRAGYGDPGSPWAIGSKHGGHKAVNPDLGTLRDFEELVARARKAGIEIAIDIAFQCSPDHPYVKDHPEWFLRLPDGTIKFAENPPKKYEDIVPFDFECENWRELWEELKSVFMFWARKGVRIFRVDNPHTKPFGFWEWVIAEVRRAFPDTLYLAEAFTRPKVMHRLAKVGFSQSYTYYTWRNTKHELKQYVTELTRSDIREFFRPNFWPNTPDILPEYLQYGGRAAFIVRFVLAATLSSNYGIYGPAYELCVNAALPEREEYLDSEKYQVQSWRLDQRGSLAEIITLVNRARRDNPALHNTWNVEFLQTDNDYLLAYVRRSDDNANMVMVVANLDPHHAQSGWITTPREHLGIHAPQSFLVHDLISDDKFVWQSDRNYVALDPSKMPVHLFRVSRRLRRETDFDYYL
ncbi:MAG: DUF3416 domain-containing protein [Chitinivibrionales bacterium]|nr:DUF3416 domain-containing protein [Chitinivibrionales bacterium]MBD3394972.1 DUF3416 domain-containing protein [Chitinivibrionales bacterium]